ncbi:MAG: hypothetical protein KatS3mg131_1385 [Candidatus Tectimicrobiota bacterium]|nr:MAG: hypothetical protein KatS3mg131_1385 [Candidatus Tectomicrobia bacterium]
MATCEAGELARLRQALYRVFATALLPPVAERLQALQEASQAFGGLACFAFYGAWQRLASGLQAPPPAAVLAEAYEGLFAASGAPCPLQASAYLAVPGEATGRLLAELLHRYAQLGLAPTAGSSADHAAVQLEAMAFLCQREAQAWEERDVAAARQALAEEAAFLGPYLLSWLPLWARRVQAAAGEGFYGRVAAAAEAFVIHEGDYLQLVQRQGAQHAHGSARL